MTLKIIELPKLVARGSSSAIFGVAIIFMLWAGVTLKYAEDRKQDRQDAERTASNFAMVFEENVLRSIGEIDKALLYLRRAIEMRSPNTDLATIANTADVLSEIIVQVAIIDEHGIMRATNAGPQPAPPLDLSDRDHFRVHVDGSEDRLYISKPVVGRASKRWSVQFSRAYSKPDRSFGGVVVASLDPSHFTKFYDKIQLGASASIALIGADGVVRSSGGSDDGFDLGQDLSRVPLFADLAGGRRESLIEQDAGVEPRLFAVRKVRGQPLWVSVGLRLSDINKDSWDSLQLNATAAALLTLLILVGIERILRSEAKRSAAEAHVARLASEDPLTGLPNRRVFRASLEAKFDRGQAVGGEPPSPFAVLFLDIDRFKITNDTLGHRVGDMLLCEVAARLTAELGLGDTLARLGGDEFAILTGMVEKPGLTDFARRIVESVERPLNLDGHQIRTSASIGIAVGPAHGEDPDTILMAADVALYAVKASTRGTFLFFDRSMTEAMAERRELELDLRRACGTDELRLEYQPIVGTKDLRPVGFEALARWAHPVRGAIAPNVFVPIAEDCGLIHALGQWALEEACRQAARWPEPIRVAVNLSPVQLSEPRFTSIVARVLAETGLRPGRLELEITERIFLEQSEATLRTLRSLRALGVRIAMDDFGTGYSSLSYLLGFPFDKIKVDRSFVASLGTGAEHSAICKAVIDVARALGMTTTAEGVETALQQEHLTMLGCDELQGYWFSPSVTVDKVPALLAAGPSVADVAA